MNGCFRSFGRRAMRSPLLVAMQFLAGLTLGSGVFHSQPVLASSTIFGGGPFYSGGQSVMNTLRASGYTTVMLWCIHVDEATGNLIYNDQLVVANGVYVGNSSWPSQLATLKTPPTSVNRIEVSVSSWGVDDFLRIKNLMNTYGTNTDSILYRNFQALKTATGADAIDFDDETHYEVDTAVKFGRMLASIGYKVTLCPYTQSGFWQSVYNQLGTNIVDEVYLQCYAGGAGNNPATWNAYFPGLKVQPGMWCKNGGGCAQGNTAAEVETQMTAWRSSAGITGGFMWLYDDMLSCTAGGTAADYATAINRAVDRFQVSPSIGFSAVSAFNVQSLPASTVFALSNGTPNSVNWSLINTSAWLSASPMSGTLSAFSTGAVTVTLSAAVATNLTPGFYNATVVFSNQTTRVGINRAFTLNSAVANWPIAVNGFNAGILAPNTSTAGSPGATAFDLPNNYCLYQTGLGAGARGLPLDGVISSKLDNTTAFQLGPYGAANALMLGNTFPRFGTLTFSNPQSYHSIAVLASSANGGGQGTLVLNFTNGTRSAVFPFHAQDWFFVTTNVAIQGFGRLKLGATLTIEDNGVANPNLYQTTINLAALGLTQAVASVTFSNPATAGAQQTTAIFGLSGMPGTVPVRAPLGLAAVPGTNATVQLSWNRSAGAVGYNIKRSVAAGGPYEGVGSTTLTNFTDSNLANGTTYYFVVTATGTSNESSNSIEVSAMPGSYRGWLLAANPVAYWPLSETVGPIANDVVRGSNGVSGGNCIFGVNGFIGAGFGSPHRAISYNGTSAYTQIPRTIGSSDFTIVFWIRTTATGGTPQWYNGRGLVDGEVGGAANDFGISLVGNKVGFGVGNPDQTLTSIKAINDGNWHQVVATRHSASGALALYIDGLLDNSATGPTGARTAAPALRMGSLQTGNNFLSGSLSDVAFFEQVLTSTQVGRLYSAATGLFYDVTLTPRWNGTNLVLNWPGNGKLLEATNVAGPWTTNAGASPVTILPTQPERYFRIKSL
jgi:hypothetical protein